MAFQIHPDATGIQRHPESDTPDGGGDTRGAQGDVAGQLRPAGHGLTDFDQARAQPRRQPGGTEQLHHERRLLPRGQPAQVSRVDIAEQTVECGALWLDIETLDIQQTAVTCLHQQWNTVSRGRLADHELHIEGITFLHDDRETVHELVHRIFVYACAEDLHRQIGIQFGDTSGRHDRLVDADVEQRSRNPVEIGQLDIVQVGQPQTSAYTFECEEVRYGMSGTLSDNSDREIRQALLLGSGQLVPVSVEPNHSKSLRAWQSDHRGPPRVVDPPVRLGALRNIRGRNHFTDFST